MTMSACATFVEGCDYTKIRLGEIELAEGECIKFKKGNTEAIGKIIAFGFIHTPTAYFSYLGTKTKIDGEITQYR